MGIKKNDAFPSNWLKADDVPATGQDVTIQSITMEEVDFGRGPQNAVNVKFNEFDKPLSLNITNWDSIEQLHGTDTDLWVGKAIRIYRTNTRNPQGATVPCIRIQPPLASAPAAPAPAANPDQQFAAKVKEIYGAAVPPTVIKERLHSAGVAVFGDGFDGDWRKLNAADRQKLIDQAALDAQGF